MSFFCMPFLACNRQIDSYDRRQCNLQTVPHDIERYARSLEEILLDCNHIKELPKFLFRCQKLQRLSLGDNDIYRLMPEISQLGSLVELNLGKNDISDIPEELKLCRELQILDLSANPITRLPATITQLSSLTKLILNDVSLTQLPADIGQLCELRDLEVRENLIRALPLTLSQLTKLQVLDLGQNELDQLPRDINNMQSLRELYVDNNDLELLPEEIARCRCLDVLDVSENRLKALPEELGDLENLSDLNVSNNVLLALPNSIGRLRRLVILRAEKNAICPLTQAIGSCTSLEELSLTSNNLTELPSSIGNLKNLKCLNVDQNHLSEIPDTIGGCVSLGWLSLRENQIHELPMEIGKCERLTVLDLCSNRLSFLPFTINVLFKLQALWLSENQSQAMLKLQQERHPTTGVKVLTCYLLPQHAAQPIEPERNANKAFVGGPKVHFGDMDSTQDEEKNLPTGNFERHGTPHPKPHATKLKKNTIDGHVIHHDDDQAQPSALVLSAKRSIDNTNAPTVQVNGPQAIAPRSALRFQSVPVQQYVPESSAAPETHTVNGSAADHPQTSTSVVQSNNYERSVAFATNAGSGGGEETHAGGTRLKRVNTPHYAKTRPQSRAPTEMNHSSSSLRGLPEPQLLRLTLRRDDVGGLGLSIAGGIESTPYKEGDQGLFVSRVAPNGPAERAGLRQGDKLVRVNDSDVLNVRHETAVQKMQEARTTIELTVLRFDESLASTPTAVVRQSPSQSLDASFVSDANDISSLTRETISTAIKRDANGSPGFSLAGGLGSGRDGIYISQITAGGAADRDGKLQVGDRVISINGTPMRGARHDQAVSLLTGHAENEVFLKVQREKPTLTSPLPPHAATPSAGTPLNTSSPSLPVTGGLTRAPSRSAPLNLLGDTTSWDGTNDDVELIKDGNSLGLSIVGGSDHSSHPFGINSPGVFISKIAVNSPASRSGKLRIGDRILEVNGRDVRLAKHIEAVDALKNSRDRVRLRVLHDKQPAGLREKTIVRRDLNGPLGISIHGGVRSSPANPSDPTDEGIFIDKVESGSVSAASGLIAGQRIIEVNGESLLGCTQEEAAAALRRSQELRLLVCDGYNSPSSRSSTPGGSVHAQDENSLDTSPVVAVNGDSSKCSEVRSPPLLGPLTDAPLATSSPLPPATAPKPSKIPPPVAPKPTLKASQVENIRPAASDINQPEKLNFNSKLQKFEHEIEIKRVGRSSSQLPPPEKKPLLSEQDMKKLKEEEAKKLLIGATTAAPLDSPEKDSFFDQLLDNSMSSGSLNGRPSQIPIRSKNAEMRAIASGQIQADEPLNEVERLAREQQKRSEWRAARLKSLDQERIEADAIMNRLQLGSMLSSIKEDRGVSPLNDRVLANETSLERAESIDPSTGERSYTITQKSFTKREFGLNSAEIGFADDSC